MPFYAPIRHLETPIRNRTIDGLLRLRDKMNAELGAHKREDTLLLATWNIRDFDNNKFGHGPREDESFHYIAEVISHFDLVAVQEINRDLGPIQKVMRLLGRNWDYIVTDITEGPSGNRERMGFLFDKRKVFFRNMAGEVVLPAGQGVVRWKDGEVDGVEESAHLQFARTPFVASFQAGWFKFNLCSVHIYYGSNYGEGMDRRVQEIGKIANFFKKRQQKENEDYILLGDFNIIDRSHATMRALEDNGFTVPEGIKAVETNLGQNCFYDQIVARVQNQHLEVVGSGAFNFTDCVFRDDQFEDYKDMMPADPDKGGSDDPEKYYLKKWRTWQMSDHLPLWTALRIDFTEGYLNSLKVEE